MLVTSPLRILNSEVGGLGCLGGPMNSISSWSVERDTILSDAERESFAGAAGVEP